MLILAFFAGGAMLTDQTEAAPSNQPVAGISAVNYQQGYGTGFADRRGGRVADLVLASTLVLFTLPVAALVCLAIKLESSGPVFSRELLLRADGRPFQALKFRTRLHLSDVLYGEPAPTRVGQLLNWTRIDDLPQLINVLRGDIAILDRLSRSSSFLQ